MLVISFSHSLCLSSKKKLEKVTFFIEILWPLGKKFNAFFGNVNVTSKVNVQVILLFLPKEDDLLPSVLHFVCLSLFNEGLFSQRMAS